MADLGVRPRPAFLYACATAVAVSSVVTAILGAPVLGWWVLVPMTAGLMLSLLGVAAATVAKAAWLHRFTVFTNMKTHADQDR